MSHYLFLALARHHDIYFRRLLEETDLRGRLAAPGDLPWPRPWDLPQVIGRIDWAAPIAEKCQERRVKRKYQGLFYRLLLRLELLWMALRLQALLTRERPTAVVMWNGSHRYYRLLQALLPQGCRTFFFENGLLPNTTTLDSQGVNFRNSVPRDAGFYRNYAAGQPEGEAAAVTLIPRKTRRTGHKPVALPERYVFVPFQEDRDSQVRLFSPWVGDMRQLFALGERLAAETGLAVVFKEHPSSRDAYPELHLRTHERLLFANGNSTQALIEGCQFVVTLNSTVGLESILLGKPVLTLGQAFFGIEGLTMQAASADELVSLARRFPDWPLDEALRKSFLCYLQREYCVPGHWKEASTEHLREVARRMLA